METSNKAPEQDYLSIWQTCVEMANIRLRHLKPKESMTNFFQTHIEKRQPTSYNG